MHSRTHSSFSPPCSSHLPVGAPPPRTPRKRLRRARRPLSSSPSNPSARHDAEPSGRGPVG
eukprot:8002044-Alexandrium_andersonii.AAC.1